MIYTGYYAKLKEYENAGLTPIAVSGVIPKFYTDRYRYMDFAPRYSFFKAWKDKVISDSEYTKMYEDYLNTLNKEEIEFDFKEYNTKEHNCILICYEKIGDFCHRHILANWLNKNFGYEVKEYVC